MPTRGAVSSSQWVYGVRPFAVRLETWTRHFQHLYGRSEQFEYKNDFEHEP